MMKKGFLFFCVFLGIAAFFLIAGIPGKSIVKNAPDPDSPGKERKEPMIEIREKASPQRSLPLMDLALPEKVETATFALG